MNERRILLTAKQLEDDGFISGADLQVGDVITSFASCPLNIDQDPLPSAAINGDYTPMSISGLPVIENTSPEELRDWINSNSAIKAYGYTAAIYNNMYVRIKDASGTFRYYNPVNFSVQETSINTLTTYDYIYSNPYDYSKFGTVMHRIYSTYGQERSYYIDNTSHSTFLWFGHCASAKYGPQSNQVWNPYCKYSIHWFRSAGELAAYLDIGSGFFQNKLLHTESYSSQTYAYCCFVKGFRITSIQNIPDNWYFKLAEEE